jgi:AcrR family transcriptional regulator
VTRITVPRRRGRFAGLAPEARRAERRRLLLDAAFHLLSTEGTAGTTVRAVCAAADLNPRYFYEGFASIDELAIAVYDRLSEEYSAGLVAAMDAAAADVVSQVRAATQHTVAFIDDDRRRARILYVESVGNAALNRRRIEAGHDLSAFLQEDARRRRRAAPEGDAIGALSSVMLVGGISEVLTAWVSGRIDVSREQLVDDLAALTVGLIDSAGAVAGRRHEALGSVDGGGGTEPGDGVGAEGGVGVAALLDDDHR